MRLERASSVDELLTGDTELGGFDLFIFVGRDQDVAGPLEQVLAYLVL